MNRHILAANRGGILGRLRRDRSGAAAVEFAFILPALLMLTAGLIEFSMVLYDFHRAGEATRRAIRAALINPPLAELDNVAATSIVCTSGGCTGAAATGDMATSFAAIVAAMQTINPDIANTNVVVAYSASGLDDVATPGVVTPVVTVSVTGLTYTYIMTGFIPGLPTTFSFPDFSTSALGPSEVTG